MISVVSKMLIKTLVLAWHVGHTYHVASCVNGKTTIRDVIAATGGWPTLRRHH